MLIQIRDNWPKLRHFATAAHLANVVGHVRASLLYSAMTGYRHRAQQSLNENYEQTLPIIPLSRVSPLFKSVVD